MLFDFMTSRPRYSRRAGTSRPRVACGNLLRRGVMAILLAVILATGSPLASQEPPAIPPPPTPCDATCVSPGPVLVCEYVETIVVVRVDADGNVTVYEYDVYDCELQ